MAIDLFIDTNTREIVIDEQTGDVRFTANQQELTRQRLDITLRTFLGEWFADLDFGTPYFQTIFGRNTKDTVDAALRTVILSVPGVQVINSFISRIDDIEETYILTFSVTVDSGEIVPVALTL